MKKIDGESGQTLVMVALSLTALLGFSALATDVGTLLHQRRIAQAAADSAAIAGATAALAVQNNASGAEEAATTAGQLDASNYGFSSSEVTINTPPTDDINSAFNNPGYVEAIVTETMPTPIISTFVHLVNPSSTYTGMTIKARAVAADTIISIPCWNVQNNANADPAADLGGNSLISSVDCTGNVNGNLTMSGSSDIVAGGLNVAGSVDFVGNKAAVPSDTSQGQGAESDPLAILSQPKYAPQGPTAPTVGGTCTSPPGAGTCFYDWQNGNLSGYLAPGVYYFDEDIHITGSLTTTTTINGTSVNTGGVTIFMNGTHIFSLKNNGTLNLTAPVPQNGGTSCQGDADPYCGILVDAPTDVATDNACVHGSNPNIIAGDLQMDFGSNVSEFEGAFYAPWAHLFLQDQGATTTITSFLDVGTLCQQSANITIAGQTINTPITKIGLVE